ncbi:hypothetical protein TNCV_948051 [Trichonephila clavipes]|nr:hypothetical protein TNCV_948051 [Trichonephila clavipes]
MTISSHHVPPVFLRKDEGSAPGMDLGTEVERIFRAAPSQRTENNSKLSPENSDHEECLEEHPEEHRNRKEG